MVDIFGKDKTSGTLSRVDTLQLDGCPVQIEALSSDEVSLRNNQSSHFKILF